MSNKVIHAIYNDDDVLMDAVKQTRKAHHHIEEVFTPFPVHGLDKAMGLAPTRLAICAFIYGCIGLSVCNMDDELHYDTRLASRYWRKTKF
jgi:hypothetical protein